MKLCVSFAECRFNMLLLYFQFVIFYLSSFSVFSSRTATDKLSSLYDMHLTRLCCTILYSSHITPLPSFSHFKYSPSTSVRWASGIVNNSLVFLIEFLQYSICLFQDSYSLPHNCNRPRSNWWDDVSVIHLWSQYLYNTSLVLFSDLIHLCMFETICLKNSQVLISCTRFHELQCLTILAWHILKIRISS